MPELVVAYLDGTEERYPLANIDVFIGRDTQLLVSIPDSKISRRHARMFLRRGSWYIEDLGSVNGVIIDGARINGAVPCSVGKNMHIGDAVLRLVADAAPKASAWLLEVKTGSLAGAKLELADATPKIIGRDSQADFTLADASVSRRHARVVAQRDGLAIEDLSSSNGTFIADQKVTSGTVRPGDSLRFGNITVVLHSLGAAGGAFAPPTKGSVKPSAAQRRRGKPGGSRRWITASALLLLVLASAAAAVHLTRRPKEPASHVAAATSSRVPEAERAAGDTRAAQQRAPVPKPVPKPVPEPDMAPAPAQAAPSPTDAAPPVSAEAAPRIDPAAAAAAPIEPGRLARAWGRLTGRGPSAQERARSKALSALYAKALAQSRTADREAALQTLGTLLSQDALHPQGRALQGQLLVRVSEADALRRAQGAMQANRALEALGIVSQALDLPFAPSTPGDQPAKAPPSTEAQELTAIGDQAALQLSQACGERAQAACMSQAWAPCIAQVACLLGYQPQATQGLALLTLATDAVRTRSNPQAVAAAASQGQNAADLRPQQTAQATVLALSSRYPQAALRQAVLIYSTGDIAAASQKLHPLTCPQCRVVGGDVRRVALGLPRAKQLRASGQLEAAIALYDEILAADTRLCPAPTPSVLHDVALEGKQAVLLLQGSAAFERGAYKEALAAYLAGMELGPKNDGLKDAVTRLAHRAQDILSSVQSSIDKGNGTGNLNATVCGHLQEVVEMTTANHPAHQTAQKLMHRCGNAHK